MRALYFVCTRFWVHLSIINIVFTALHVLYCVFYFLVALSQAEQFQHTLGSSWCLPPLLHHKTEPDLE